VLLTSRPSVGKEELSQIGKVLDSGWLGMGSLVFEFENKLKEFLGAKHVIAVNTGTSALHISLDALDLKPTDEVIVPSLTYVSSIQAIVASRAKPVFCEVCPDTLNIDINDMKRKITGRTRAVMPMHYSGLPCLMDEILKITKSKNIKVVEDAAHAFGSYYKGKKIGSFGDITCFSFDPIKNITCGEGGAVVTADDKLAEKIIMKRILGIDKDTWHRYKNKRSWSYDVKVAGFRYHMSNINAAIGIEQLNKFKKFIQRKKEIVKKYDQAFRDISQISLLTRDYKNTAPFNYIIKVKDSRDALIDFLKTKGIEAGIHYIPNHLHSFFAPYRIKLPVTEKLYGEIVTLPLYYDLSSKDVNSVIKAVREFLKGKK